MPHLEVFRIIGRETGQVLGTAGLENRDPAELAEAINKFYDVLLVLPSNEPPILEPLGVEWYFGQSDDGHPVWLP